MADARRRSPDRGRAIGPAILALSVLALHFALLWLSFRPEPRVPYGDEPRYWSDARIIASGAEWSPQPIWPLLYPELLAVVMRVADGTSALPALIALQAALLVGASLLWGDLARRLTGSTLAGWIAGALLLLDPQIAAFVHYLWPEIVHLFLFVAALWLAATSSGRPGRLAGAGLLFGLAVLTKKLLWPFLPLLVWPALREASDGRSRLRRGAWLAAGFVAALLPALVAFGPYAVSPMSSAAFNLWVGLNDTGRTSFAQSIVESELDAYERAAPESAGRDRRLLEKVGERVAGEGAARLLLGQIGRQYFRLFDKDSFFTEQLPGGDIHRAGAGYRRAPPRFAELLRIYSYAIYGAVLLAAVAGWVVMPPRGRRWLKVLTAFVAFNLAIYLFLHVKSRYRIQFLPVLYLYAGVAVVWALDRLGVRPRDGEGWRERIGRAPALLGALAAVALAVCFFGG